ncbi:MAG: 30S ribosomal protein S1 [Candidatus Schekmanbacteria bacterium GWA2_38_9]|uniref:Small ribosomal subunit protein bS1 n=1 Tax=Candidatus Schekmanbacteria bacterium RIFCSPLOWO2_12_FULL_38_15 TaxID=1817883 RepID=A0A1F7SIY4_9BACT|nr:MAG: 30S ribosomal protein S1 [Candidatus Schekmanbacteria bacterium GWA2_38_9]OGL49291.1 MAG: 30S ribosomal protein S1 [Candidatus Schekmanbacteria bacterium RIFCSPLOWO2_02_FULL_38_14]OGL53756.1 MAG: 30S ribosomal protein S1 [Candidatus Schekmanbacteria bacterium RIFCSPLOWO2_12_FULL_38_15]
MSETRSIDSEENDSAEEKAPIPEGEDILHEEMERLYAETMKEFKEGKVVKGTIIRINSDTVLVDIGYKSEGIIPINEFRSESGELPSLKVGDEVEVYLDKIEDKNGQIVLSKEKAEKIKIWDEVTRIYEKNEIIRGKVISRIKGGLTVDIGIKAFLPGSQIDLRPVKNLDKLIGKILPLKIIKINQKRGNIVLSRRKLLEEEREEKKADLFENLKENQTIKGTVKNITEYGVFIDLGGIDGLLHITDMTWGRINHPSEMFALGDEINVKVLKIDKENEKVSLGLKQITEDPWTTIEKKYPVDSRVKGKVVSLTEYGAFIELETGIEGLIHVSEMSWTKKIRHPSKILAMGDNIEAVVLNIDVENKRISLGIKQCEPNPWDLIEKKYPIGSIVEGNARNITDFGVFIGLEEGIDGLVHISDMSWSQKLKHPSEVVKKGQTVKAKVLSIDKENERLSLGFKQLQPDPWEKVPETYRVDDVVRGKITKFANFGAFMELEDGIEGLIHISELSTENVSKPEDAVSIDQEIEAKIIRIDTSERKIGLSIRSLTEAKVKGEVDEYLESQGQLDTSIKALSGKNKDI